MQIAIWIFVGLAAGWLAGKSLEGTGYGVWMTACGFLRKDFLTLRVERELPFVRIVGK